MSFLLFGVRENRMRESMSGFHYLKLMGRKIGHILNKQKRN